MTETGNGSAGPVPVLAGHLVIYGDAVAFRPDGADQVVVRPLISMARDQLCELLSEGDGGMLASIMNGQLPKMNRETRRQMTAAAKAAARG